MGGRPSDLLGYGGARHLLTALILDASVLVRASKYREKAKRNKETMSKDVRTKVLTGLKAKGVRVVSDR